MVQWEGQWKRSAVLPTCFGWGCAGLNSSLREAIRGHDSYGEEAKMLDELVCPSGGGRRRPSQGRLMGGILANRHKERVARARTSGVEHLRTCDWCACGLRALHQAPCLGDVSQRRWRLPLRPLWVFADPPKRLVVQKIVFTKRNTPGRGKKKKKSCHKEFCQSNVLLLAAAFS